LDRLAHDVTALLFVPGILAAVLLLPLCFLYLVLTYGSVIAPALSKPVLVLPAIALGLLLYRMRGQRPLLYGMAEISSSIAVIFVSMFPQTDYLSLGGAGFEGLILTKGLGILGGIYVL